MYITINVNRINTKLYVLRNKTNENNVLCIMCFQTYLTYPYEFGFAHKNQGVGVL